jgi:hypothetical protein
MFLTSPASYVTLADLKADTTLDLTDRLGNPIPDPILNDLLEENSGQVDARIGMSFLPQEQKIRIQGNGSNWLFLNRKPLLYVRQVKIVLPNSAGFDVPIQSLLADHQAGFLENMTPLTFQGIGITTLFPEGLPIDVWCAWGLGYVIPAPTFQATADYTGAQYPLAAGTYAVQATSVSYSGESLPGPVQNVTLTQPGRINVTITDMPGAMRFFMYVNGVFARESQAYAIGDGTIAAVLDASPVPLIGYDPTGALLPVPTKDTSAAPFAGIYGGLRRLTKLMLQKTIWEQKNLSNQGVYSQSSGPKRQMWKDNMHSSIDKIIDDLSSALAYQGIA